MKQTETINKLMAYAVEHFHCLLCDKPAVYGATFIPNKAKKYGAKPGKGRAFMYALCERCKNLPDRDARVAAACLFKGRRRKSMDIRTFSPVQKEELIEILKGHPCALCNSWTDHFLQRELDEEESEDLGVGLLVVSVCECCMNEPSIERKLEEYLQELRKKTREQKQGKILSFSHHAKNGGGKIK